MKEFNGERLRYLRFKKGVKQKVLAKLLGVTPAAVSNWERGTDTPSVENIKKIADYFGVEPDFFLYFFLLPSSRYTFTLFEPKG